MKVLVIGGARFLGRAIVNDLVARGHDVTVMNRGSRPPLAGVRAIPCDKSDLDAFRSALTTDRWDAVLDTILNEKDLELAVAVLRGRIGHFIHTGSIGVYAPARHIPARESDPLADTNAEFAFTGKLRQDRVLLRAHAETAFPATILRMSCIYGPGDVPLDGWGGRHPAFFQRLRDKAPIPLPDEGRALLHPGYVADLGRAFGDALEREESIGQVYNIGGDRALTMRDYVARIAEALGVEPNFEPATAADILDRFAPLTNRRGLLFSCEHMCCDTSKARRDLGWRPRMPLDTGLRLNIEWMQEEGLI